MNQRQNGLFAETHQKCPRDGVARLGIPVTNTIAERTVKTISNFKRKHGGIAFCLPRVDFIGLNRSLSRLSTKDFPDDGKL